MVTQVDIQKIIQRQRADLNPVGVKTKEYLDYERRLAEQEALKKRQEEEYQRQVEQYNIDLLSYNQQVEENKRKQAQYEKDLEEYNLLKLKADEEEKVAEAEYKKQLEEYNKQLEEQKKAEEEYNAQLSEFNKQEEANRLAYKLYWKAKEGKNPYISDQDPLVRKYYYYYQNKEDAKIAQELTAKATSLTEYKKIYDNLTDDIKKYAVAPVTLEAQYLKRLQSGDFPDYTSQGFQGMTTKEGIIFTPIPGKSNIQLDSLGQPYNAIPTLSPFTEQSPIKKTVLMQTIEPPKTILPSYSVQVPLSQISIPKPQEPLTYKEFTSGSRYIGGTLDYLGFKARNLVSQQKIATEDYSPMQIRGTFVDFTPEQKKGIIESKTLLAKDSFQTVIRSTPYFIPIGGQALMIGEGIESYGTKGGRSKIEEEKQSLISKGYNPILSSFISSGKPVLETVGGFFGLKSELKALKINKEAKLFEQAPLKIKGTIYEGETGGFAYTKGIKQTEPGILDRALGIKPIEYKVSIKQPFYRVGEEGLITLEGGKGIAYTQKGNTRTFRTFETGGTAKPISSIPKAIYPSKFSREFEADVGIGKVYTKQTGVGTVSARGFEIPLSKPEYLVDINYKKINAPKTYEPFTGVTKETEEGTTAIISGKAKSIRVQKPIEISKELKIGSNEFTIISKPETYGYVKRVVPSSEESSGIIILGGGTKTPLSKTFKQTTASFIKPLAEKGIRTIKPVSSSIKLAEPITPTIITASKFTGQGTYERYSPSESLVYRPVKVQLKEESLGDNSFKVTGQNNFNIIDTQRFKNLGITDSRFNFIEPTKPKEAVYSFEKEKLKDFIRPELRILQKPKEVERQKFIEVNIQRPVDNTRLRPRLTQVPKQPNIPVPKIPTPNVPKPVTTKTPPPVIVLKNKGGKLTSEKVRVLSKAFEVLVRSKGKVNVVGKGLTRGEALRLGVKTTKGSTAQTFAIRESGTTTKRDIGYKVPETLFSTPKRKSTLINDMTFTERRGKTLTERSEISSLKSSKRGKSKFSLL